MNLVVKKDGIPVEMKDVNPGEKVTLSLVKPPKLRGLRAMGAMTPAPSDTVELGSFTLAKSSIKTPEDVHTARTLTPEQLQARIAKWRENHPDLSEKQLAKAAAFVRANRP